MKKFDNFISNLNILSKAQNEDLTNEFIISGIIDKFFVTIQNHPYSKMKSGWPEIAFLIAL